MSDFNTIQKIYQFQSKSEMLEFMDSCDMDCVGSYVSGGDIYEVIVIVPVVGGN